MITYQQEFFSNIPRSEYQELIKTHWKEVALNKDKVPLDPDYDRYLSLEEANAFKVFTVRDDGKLVGYFAVFVFPHMHYKTTVFAQNDVIYIDPSYRQGFRAIRLIKFAEECLIEDGVDVLQINTKVSKDFGPLLERLGFNLTDKVYGKYLNT